ncbi:2943_t:CDS:2, partial [Entrophospora sp. SA101]
MSQNGDLNKDELSKEDELDEEYDKLSEEDMNDINDTTEEGMIYKSTNPILKEKNKSIFKKEEITIKGKSYDFYYQDIFSAVEGILVRQEILEECHWVYENNYVDNGFQDYCLITILMMVRGADEEFNVKLSTDGNGDDNSGFGSDYDCCDNINDDKLTEYLIGSKSFVNN